MRFPVIEGSRHVPVPSPTRSVSGPGVGEERVRGRQVFPASRNRFLPSPPRKPIGMIPGASATGYPRSPAARCFAHCFATPAMAAAWNLAGSEGIHLVPFSPATRAGGRSAACPASPGGRRFPGSGFCRSMSSISPFGVRRHGQLRRQGAAALRRRDRPAPCRCAAGASPIAFRRERRRSMLWAPARLKRGGAFGMRPSSYRRRRRSCPCSGICAAIARVLPPAIGAKSTTHAGLSIARAGRPVASLCPAPEMRLFMKYFQRGQRRPSRQSDRARAGSPIDTGGHCGP